jgi:hypothetical protein
MFGAEIEHGGRTARSLWSRETNMIDFRPGMLKAVCLSAALLGAVSTVVVLGLADPVHAAGGKGGGNGNDGGNGGGKGGNGGNGNGNGGNGHGDGNSKDTGGSVEDSPDGASNAKQDRNGLSDAKGAAKKSSETAEADDTSDLVSPKARKLAKALGVHPSDLGALNAAHASPKALENASPKSRLGKLRAYRDAVLAGKTIQDELDAAVAALAGLTPPEKPSAEIGADLETAREERSLAQENLDLLREELEAVGGVDAALEAEIATLEEEIILRDEQILDLEGDLTQASAYETAADAVELLQEQVDEQDVLETSLLEEAANKPVTAEVEMAVQRLLDID